MSAAAEMEEALQEYRNHLGEPIGFPDYDPGSPPDYAQRTAKLRVEVQELLAGLR